MKFVLNILFLFLSCSLFSKDIKVKILPRLHSTSISFTAQRGNYFAFSSGEIVADIPENSNVIIQKNENDSLNLFVNGRSVGHYALLRLVSPDTPNHFGIQSMVPSSNIIHHYDNSLIINIWAGELQLINELEMDNYVAGVVEAEVGHLNNLELFKVQAIISRTYTLKYLGKNMMSGYDFSDDVLDQAYRGRNRFNALVRKAVKQTQELIIVDKYGNPISAAFHSNSGGQTCNSEDYWIGKPESYLRSVKDPFSVGQSNYSWEKKFSLLSWKTYLASKGIYEDLCLCQNPERPFYIICKGVKLSTREIREDLKLNSSFFSIIKRDGNIIIKGKGYGHGIGMSQEGAARMAQSGYTYEEIIRFYYTNVEVRSIK